MMARMARLVLPGMAFHVVQRGNHLDTVFVTDQDRQVFLKILREYSERYQLRILGYCLMSNHYHVICLTDRENSMALTFGRANAEYSRWIHIQRRQAASCLSAEFGTAPQQVRPTQRRGRKPKRAAAKEGLPNCAMQ
jgi:putative transposase